MKDKRKVILSIVFLCVVVLGIVMVGVWKHFTDYNTTLQANWGISLPSKAHYSEIYSKDSGASFHGDGIRCHIFSYKDQVPISEWFSWKTGEENSSFYRQCSNDVSAWLDEIDVPSEYRPDYPACLYWCDSHEDSSEIVILWNKGKKTIYVVESFL